MASSITSSSAWTSRVLITALFVSILSFGLGSSASAQTSIAPEPAGTGTDLIAAHAEAGVNPSISAAPDTASISGTVIDSENEIIPGATIVLEGPSADDRRTAVANDLGSFGFTGLNPGGPYYITIKADGFSPWRSEAVSLSPGQFFILSGIRMMIAGGETSVTVLGSSEQIAAQQVAVAEKQRVMGVIPNFYVVYDHDPAPLTTRLKFQLAFRAGTDPIVFLGSAMVAGMDQAGDTPDYAQGAKGYGQRLGANYATGFTDIMLGGAILPSLLHQDPRYFYQGTGTTRSRVFHALSSPFICRGDSGRWEPNFSSVGGDLAASAISNTYYPETSRGTGLVMQNFLVTTSGRMVNSVIQEFLLKRITSGARNRN
jgi:hypothetical protein